MGKFFATSLLVGCIFFLGVFFGTSITQNQTGKPVDRETESIFGAYVDWQETQKSELEKSRENTQEHQEKSVYSTIANSISVTLKNVSRTVVFHLLALFERLLT